MSELSDLKRRQLRTLAGTDIPISEAAYIVGVPYCPAFVYICARRRGFDSLSDYLDYLAKGRGYKSNGRYVHAMMKERNGSRGR